MFGKKRTYLPKSPLISKGKTKVSFCIPHRDRLSFLQQTLSKNLSDNKHNQDRVDFVLVDFGSEEDVTSWVRSQFEEELKTGYLKYFLAIGLNEWHASVAKNTAHKIATGDILVNLDCDNFTGSNGGKFVIDQFESASDNLVLWQYSKKKLDGTFGRIALTNDLFQALGGYDENLLQMGYQDGDLKDRAMSMGARLVHNRDLDFNQAIKNEKFVPKNMSWKKMNERNEQLSKSNIKNGHLVANQGEVIGLRQVERRLFLSSSI